jgi:glutamine synthetase
MTKTSPTLDRFDLKQRVDAGEIDTVLAVFPDIYGRLMGKRFDGDHFVAQIAEGGTHACNYLLTVDMEMEPVPGYEFANWQKGYGDFHLVPDLRSLRQASWLERTALVLFNQKASMPESNRPRVRCCSNRSMRRAKSAST